MIVTVIDTTYEDHGSIIVFTGTTEDGTTVRFGVDRRIAVDLMEQLDQEGEIHCSVEAWQVLGSVES